jgi:hypothetical protein
MKRLLLILVVIIGFHSLIFGQYVGVQVIGGSTEDTEQKDKCPYRINGICTSEDLGGVEAVIEKINHEEGYFADGYYGRVYFKYIVKLKNYNDFTVSVIYETKLWGISRTGVVVLKPNEEKTVNEENNTDPPNVVLIARKLNK